MKASIWVVAIMIAPILASPKYRKKSWSSSAKPTNTWSSSPPGPSDTNGYSSDYSNDYSKKKSTGNANQYQANQFYQQPASSNGASGSSDTYPPSQTGSLASGNIANGTVISSGSITLPAGCQQKNDIGIGWLPSDTSLSTIEGSLGAPSCWDGQYAQITTTGAYTDSNQQLLGHLKDISNPANTIFVASVMPTISMSQVDDTVAQGVANVLSQFTTKGIEVWLRYAHEMNYYTTSGSEGGHYDGNPDTFKTSWAAMSRAVKANAKIKMFWSPNSGSPDDLQQWYPTEGQVDMVGIDIYPKEQQSFADVYGAFCQKFSSASIPFVIGETGAGPSLKDGWFKELVSPEAKTACPNYLGFSWFEYDKEADFRVATAGENIAKQVLSS
ncbi:uncharacterized protein KY384_007160 [Bacidia gigantensis]|uniref:uncharacterized protein n=1 Tax=Bacidia gigantensis TaxID=2732470 RepID=UPI001D041A00|nr:uncharacterized protein KY384_007160 [Bacidia gigantensis]KAG8528243.1 hypothetical protein KY384_007160 [Bacidia gigantensis]